MAGATTLMLLGWFLAPVLLWQSASLRLRVAASLLGAAAVVGATLALGLSVPIHPGQAGMVEGRALRAFSFRNALTLRKSVR